MSQGLHIVVCETAFSAHRLASRTCSLLRDEGKRVVHLLPSPQRADIAAMEAADNGEARLGWVPTTPSRWVRDLWALYGDGRAIAAPVQRKALAVRALEETPTSTLVAHATGMPACLLEAVSQAAGTPAFERSDGDFEGTLSQAETDLHAACRAYMRLLDENGLVELGTAAALLPEAMGTHARSHLVMEDPGPLPEALLGLITNAAQREGVTVVAHLSDPRFPVVKPQCVVSDTIVSRLIELAQKCDVPVSFEYADDEQQPWSNPELLALSRRVFMSADEGKVEPTGAVSFCLPAGRYAEPEAVSNAILELTNRGFAARDIVVTCKDPLNMLEGLRGRLATRGVSVQASGTVPLGLTDAARAALGLVMLARRERASGPLPGSAFDMRSIASNLTRNPLLKVSDRDALSLDAKWRSSRLTSACDYLDDIAQASPEAARAIGLVRDGDLPGALESLVPAFNGTTSATAHVRRAAARAVADSFGEAARLGVDTLARAEALIANASVGSNALVVGDSSLLAQQNARVLWGNPNAVRVTTLQGVAGAHARAVIVCDLDADSYSLKENVGATGGYLAALGLEPRYGRIDVLRRDIFSAIEAASEALVLERRLFDENAKEKRPCVLFEEVVDCYLDDTHDIEMLDKATGLPKDGSLPQLDQVGEERFSEVANPLGTLFAPALLRCCAPATGLDDPTSHELLANPSQPLSPSSLELYMSCPKRWFFERCLRDDAPDAAFGDLEMGAFVHAVLHDVHEELARREVHVTRDFLADRTNALALQLIVEESFDTQRATHANPDEDVENRLVAINDLESRRMGALRARILDCVRRDADLPEGFKPLYHEWSFGNDGDDCSAVAYGGALLRGRIDRVDVDRDGRALIVDYKGGLGNGYSFSKQDPTLPMHTQALMYASALSRAKPELHPSGCLYVSYKRPLATGFLSTGLLLPTGSSVQKESFISEVFPEGFDVLLQRVEDQAAEATERLFAGNIEPEPRFGRNSCSRCTVTDCPRRVM